MSDGKPALRIDYVDRLRGLAVVGMFFVHSPGIWARPEVNAGPFGRTIGLISGLIAPVFMFLAGISVSIVAERAREKGRDEAAARRGLARRGFWILAAGYGLNCTFFVFRAFRAELTLLYRIDILQCIGAGLMLAVWLAWPKRRINTRALWLAGFFVLGTQLTWRLPIAEYLPWFLGGYLAFIKGAARFPLFPYAAWIFLGLFVGPIWYGVLGNAGKERRFWASVFAVAAIAFAGGCVLEYCYYLFGINRPLFGVRPPSTSLHQFLFKLSVLLSLFTVSWLSAPLFGGERVGPLLLFGRTSLFAYCVHLILIYHLFGLFWRHTLGATEQLLGSVLLTFLMWGVCYAWRRYEPGALLGRVRRLA